ncbi:acetyl-CoA carboxylase biotin carboxylase subunit [Negadavirga shengliensis]|uniref:Acetyl/propionyl/methylcrotonyl-CoA carboxylase subunit alpha n=1 Tax=Negadavirga shengliensis TaxID=1389218 RepID=A0ABV9T742_9BACT
MRTAREMGISTVAVYSEADVYAPHVRFADEAVCIGPAPSSQSYLNMDKIIETALELGADAIHPGYGFLSENALFAEKVKQAGLVFIGPSPQSIAIMGSKLEAKKAAAQYGIPLVPGTEKAVTDLDEAKIIAGKTGYPILIKASAGGGGKGMRIVEDESQLEEQMQRAMGEARSAFGDASVFIEKYILSPKHIEVQVLGDHHGNVVHLFERECSIQRRHQKVIEEAPSPVIDDGLRKKMGESAIKAAKACGYYGAGTVEFIVDERLNFYFLEMNTRLQVEHPVTEMITGVDLVREQIRIAEGQPLSFAQKDLSIRGHAIEIRVYAEDPENNFLPDTGKLQTYIPPKGPGVRVDDGYEEGMEIPIHYDPMVAKLIVHAFDRNAAIRRMQRAIDEYHISGIKNTLAFCRMVIGHPEFQSGKFNTHFVDVHFSPKILENRFTGEEMEILAAFGAVEYQQVNPSNAPYRNIRKKSDWKKRKYNG